MLKQQGLTGYQVKTEVRAQRLPPEQSSKKVTSDVKVSKAEVAAYYTSHKSQYGQPETRQVRHILVQKTGVAGAQLKSGANFAALANSERSRLRRQRRQAHDSSKGQTRRSTGRVRPQER